MICVVAGAIHDHGDGHQHSHEHGHTHEVMDSPGSFLLREKPLQKRDFKQVRIMKSR